MKSSGVETAADDCVCLVVSARADLTPGSAAIGRASAISGGLRARDDGDDDDEGEEEEEEDDDNDDDDDNVVTMW
jgi:ribosomal protein L12E/L44/L45/RPP1/RPP2